MRSAVKRAGLGWLLLRSKAYLPESLQFHENYLGAHVMLKPLPVSLSSML